MTYSKSLNPGFRVKVNSKLEWKESPFLANPAWVGISVPGNQKVPNDTNGEQGRPSLCAYKIHSQMGAAAAAAKLLQSCLTLCDPIDGSPPGSPVPGILQARTLEWVAISFSHA